MDGMDLKEYLKESAAETEAVIVDTLRVWRGQVLELSPKLIPLVDVFIDGCAGGKRLRAMLVRLGYELVAGNKNSDIYKPASAVEVFQTGILAQDDIIDQSPLRRGKPSLYKAMGGEHYGISQTIILGDIGMFLGVKLISESNFLPERKNQAVSVFSQMMINTGLGEMLDVEISLPGKEKNEEDMVTISQLKTAYYTFIYPFSIGAILAGAESNIVKLFKEFGLNLGVAYQIQDDILGVFGDEKTLGKSVTSDIEEGKNTLLITFALEHADEKQREVLDQYYGKGEVTEKVHEQIKKVFTDTGALEYSRSKAVEYVKVAKEVIPKITSNLEQMSLLEGLADFLINREK